MNERADKVALVVGASGVVGRNLLQHLLTLDGWSVIALSRRDPDLKGEYRLAEGRRMYINRGLGYMQRVRFNCRPEITVFTLTAA